MMSMRANDVKASGQPAWCRSDAPELTPEHCLRIRYLAAVAAGNIKPRGVALVRYHSHVVDL